MTEVIVDKGLRDSVTAMLCEGNEKSMVCPSVARTTSDVNETSVAQIYTACW
jgi:hypothetical protein